MKRPTEEINGSVTTVRAWIEHLERAIDGATTYADLQDPETGDLDQEGCEDCFGFDGDPLETLIDLSRDMQEIAKEFLKKDPDDSREGT